jgi:hypothetical protein
VIATLVVALTPAGAATSDILQLDDFPPGWVTAPVLPSDSRAPSTPACDALVQQQSKSLTTVGTPKFVDPRASSDLDVVAASVSTFASSRAARDQVTALLTKRLLRCLVDATNAKFESESAGAKASTTVRRIRIPRSGDRVHALEAKTTVTGSDPLTYIQQVVFVREGKRIATLHVDSEGSADYTALRNRLVPLIQQRLRDGGALHV